MIELFAPKQAGKSLSLHATRVFRQMAWSKSVIEFVCVLKPVREHMIELFFRERTVLCLVGKSQTNRLHLARRKLEDIMGRGFGSHMVWIDHILFTIYDIIVKAILYVHGAFRVAVQAPRVRLIFGKEQRGLTFAQ